jgi:hypothetical protein
MLQRPPGLKEQKVFWFFFSKKNFFLPFFASPDCPPTLTVADCWATNAGVKSPDRKQAVIAGRNGEGLNPAARDGHVAKPRVFAGDGK